MPSWVLKAGTQKILSGLPGAHAVNHLLQEWFTHSLDLTADRLTSQLEHCARHLEAFVRARGRVPETALEVGTGWSPLVPLGLHLCGTREVWTLDRVTHLSTEGIRRTLRALSEKVRAGELVTLLPRAVPERVVRLVELSENGPNGEGTRTLAGLGIRAWAGDATRIPLSAGSAELTFTNSVLQHMKVEVVEGVLREMRRVVSREGVTSHFIDLGDHYISFDPSIGVYNFLKFSDRAWKLVNSRLHLLNRLRISDYRRLFSAAGWEIREEASKRGSPADLEAIRLAPRFRQYPLDDLLVYRSWITAVPSAS